jgi:hypothetical protein
MTDAQTYFDEMVVPTLGDFETAPASIRRAFLACVVLFHTVDYLAAGLAKKQNLRKQFRRESVDFAIVDRVAHAFKHLGAGHRMSRDNKPLGVSAVFSRPPAAIGIMKIGISRIGDATGGVEIENERGQDLLDVAKRAAEFLRTKL